MTWREAWARAAFLPLVPSALLLCARFRVALWFRPFERAIAFDRSVGRGNGAGRASASDISRAVYFASHFVPAATCLTQALAVREMMARNGQTGDLQIGVGTSGAFRAHAWITAGGQIVHGRTNDEDLHVMKGTALQPRR